MQVFGYKVELVMLFPVIWHLAIAQPLNFGDIMSFHPVDSSWPQNVLYFFTKEDVQLGQRPDLARCRCAFPSAQCCVRSVQKRKKFIRCMFAPALFLPL